MSQILNDEPTTVKNLWRNLSPHGDYDPRHSNTEPLCQFHYCGYCTIRPVIHVLLLGANTTEWVRFARETLQSGYNHEATASLHENLQRESHKTYGPPTSVT